MPPQEPTKTWKALLELLRKKRAMECNALNLPRPIAKVIPNRSAGSPMIIKIHHTKANTSQHRWFERIAIYQTLNGIETQCLYHETMEYFAQPEQDSSSPPVH